MAIRFYNTMTRRKEIFRPLEGRGVRLYTCGPTVYAFAQLGNWRTFLFEDILRRALEYFGYEVRQVMNITDVGHLVADADEGEDKVEKSAQREGKSPWEIARFYTRAFFEDMRALNVAKPHLMPKATEYIQEMIALIGRLQQKGFTYRTPSGVYFDISKFRNYGKLARIKISGQRAGARVGVKGEKKNPLDFALWIMNQPQHIMQWNSPWGKGFPGWHIECSTMALALLGESIDIHTGGIDHIGTHHTNEIVQSEAATGKPFARFWMHGAFLTVGGGRMGKSEGNALTVGTLKEKGIDPLAYRYFVLTTHYRKSLAFSWKALDAASRSLENLRAFVREVERSKSTSARARGKKALKQAQQRFERAIADDLNTPRALAAMWDLIRGARQAREDYDMRAVHDTLLAWDRVLGVNLKGVKGGMERVPQRIAALVRERETARRAKDWTRADTLRKQIEAAGYRVQDTTGDPKLAKVTRQGSTKA